MPNKRGEKMNKTEESKSQTKNVNKMTPEKIKETVRKGYAKVATSPKSCCDTSCDCHEPFTGGGETLASSLGYDTENIPKSATESFAGCGNPVALSDIKENETVLDLGSGAGLDAFMAAKKVGNKGRVIGVDMTPEMVKKARENAEKMEFKNVEFRLGDIEKLPVDDETIDVIISNCVINLTPDKHKTFREAYRVLKPGGRMFVSDIVLEEELPKEVKESIEGYVACISGAIEEQKYLQTMKDAGFENVEIIGKTKSRYIASDKIRAFKPKNT
jgi:arsenite methyltransferase